MASPRDKFIDLDNALLDCLKSAIKKKDDPSLQKALDQELNDEPERDEPGGGWV